MSRTERRNQRENSVTHSLEPDVKPDGTRSWCCMGCAFKSPHMEKVCKHCGTKHDERMYGECPNDDCDPAPAEWATTLEYTEDQA